LSTPRSVPSSSSLSCSAPPRALHSFPTRRSSDLLGSMITNRGLIVTALTMLIAFMMLGGMMPYMLNEHFNNGQLLSIVNFVDLRSEEHTSELQSRENLVCRLLLEKKKKESATASL